MPPEVIHTGSEAETVRVGEQLAQQLLAGAVVLLVGELGAGKTALVRGIARGLGADDDQVSSPTFTLIQEYKGGRSVLYHVDLYRLAPIEAADLGLDELISGDAIVVIEWAERWRTAPGAAMNIRIEDEGEDRRRIEVDGGSASR